jgi:YHS domain-containing protein
MTKIDFTSLSRILTSAILGFLTVTFLLNWTATGNAFERINQTFWGVAIKGYDTVAYHTEGRAIKGQPKYSHEWNDAKWYFASAENRDLFAADPERYAPQYGGY